MNSTYVVDEEFKGGSGSGGADVHKFYAMTDKEHKTAGHIKDSTGSWVDPKNYIDTYYMDW